MKKTIFITRMSEEWNGDYLKAFESLSGVVKELFERAEEEDCFPFTEEKELISIMEKRYEKGCIELLSVDGDDELDNFQDLTEFSVQAVTLEK